MTNLTLEKSDLKKIGHTLFSEDGNVAIVCDLATANIEEILLRNVLKCFGDYKIVSTEDCDDDSIEYVTNLPYEAIL